MASTDYSTLIQKAYLAYYGRFADYAGLTYWTQQLANNGGNLNGIINAFANSAESQTLYGNVSNAQRVTEIYQLLFGRVPDTNGLNFYTNLLNTGQLSVQSIALVILNGAGGGDLTLVNNKLLADSQATAALHAAGADHVYSGESTSLSFARQFTAGITASSSATDINNSVNNLVNDLYQDTLTIAHTLPGVLTHSSDGHVNLAVSRAIDPNLIVNGVNVYQLSDKFNPSSYDFLNVGVVTPTGATTNASGEIAISTTKAVLLHSQGSNSFIDVALNSVNTGALPSKVSDTLNTVVDTQSGNFLAVGSENSVAHGVHDAYAVVLDGNGNKVVERSFSQTTSSLAPYLDDGFTNAWALSNGDLVLERASRVYSAGSYSSYNYSYYETDSNLNILQSLSLTAPSSNSGSAPQNTLKIQKMVEDGHGGFVALTSTDGAANSTLVYLDQSWNITATRTLDSNVVNLSAANFISPVIDVITDIAVNNGQLYALVNLNQAQGPGNVLMTLDGSGPTANVIDAKEVLDRNGNLLGFSTLKIDNGNAYLTSTDGKELIIRTGVTSVPNYAGDYRVVEVAGGSLQALPAGVTLLGNNINSYTMHDISLIGNPTTGSVAHNHLDSSWGSTNILGGLY